MVPLFQKTESAFCVSVSDVIIIHYIPDIKTAGVVYNIFYAIIIIPALR